MSERKVITGIILASGFSRRMGEEKLLLDVGGLAMVERVIRAVRASLLSEVILIYRLDAVGDLGSRYGIETVYNPHAARGQSEAVKLGIIHAHPDTDGYLFLVGDQPRLSHSTLNRLIGVFARMLNRIIIPVYDGLRGNPVIFPASLKCDLLCLEGDCGGRVVAERRERMVTLVPIEQGIEGADIDTREAYEKIGESLVERPG